MGARVNKIRHDENTRAKIQVALLINRLQGCVEGTLELSAVQVSAAKCLIDKALPSLQSVDAAITQVDMEHATIDELRTAIAQDLGIDPEKFLALLASNADAPEATHDAPESTN